MTFTNHIYARAQVDVKVRAADLPEDVVVHQVFHHHEATGPWDDIAWQGHADNVRDVFLHGTGTGATHWDRYSGRLITVKVYDMSDMKPRPVKATSTHTPAPWSSAQLGPREVDVSLRYYAGRNIKGKRGGIRLGPLDLEDIAETVSNISYLMTGIIDLGTALGAIGGLETSWVLHHPSLDPSTPPTSPGGTSPAAYSDITDIWVNDQWGHVTSRERAEVMRLTGTITPGIP